MRNKLSSFLVAALLASGLTVVGYAYAADGGKNLKVLPKTMSKGEIKKTMKEMSKSLGVQCDHCHDTDDMSKDTDMKNTARAMMKMTADVNRKYFKGQSSVTCATCHAGSAKPKN